jgi:predicted O-methyltransferase YrrM
MDGQLNDQEKAVIIAWVEKLKPSKALEVGTWLGGGSTVHILRTLQTNAKGHLWGIEASKPIYEKMIANISAAGNGLLERFTPILGFSQQVIPKFLKENEAVPLEFVFLDGGDNPMEQIEEFQLLRDHLPVGGVLISHDAKLRKGKWLVPYLRAHDNWQCQLHDISSEGLFEAVKVAAQPSSESANEAEALLRKLRRQPIELAGRILPSGVINIIAKLLPRRILLSLSQGRK